jgi:hypothetical protein
MYPNRNPAWKQALLIIDFQGNTRKGSSTSLSEVGNQSISPTMTGVDSKRQFSDSQSLSLIVAIFLGWPRIVHDICRKRRKMS